MKWVKSQKKKHVKTFSPHQYFNHFVGSQRLTNHFDLCDSLEDFSTGIKEVKEFYPRAFHFSKKSKIEEFKREFFTAGVLVTLKKHFLYLRSVLSEKSMAFLQRKYAKERRDKSNADRLWPKNKIHRVYRKGKVEEYRLRDYINPQKNLKFETNCYLLLTSFSFIGSLVRQIDGMEDEEMLFTIDNFSKKILKKLYIFSLLNPPYHKTSPHRRAQCSVKLDDWATPNQKLIYKIFKFHKIIEEKMNEYYKEIGVSNAWIVKSVFLKEKYIVSNRLEEILFKGESEPHRGTVVSKYLENSILYPLVDFRSMKRQLHKIDFRAFVLVLSFQPLIIYKFEGFYGRICQLPFSKNFTKKFDLDSRMKHLSNFNGTSNTTTMQNNGEKRENILGHRAIKEYFKEEFSVDWDSHIDQLVDEMIIAAFQAADSEIKTRKRSFEIFSVDFIVTKKGYKPYLLDINSGFDNHGDSFLLNRLYEEMLHGLFSILRLQEKMDYGIFCCRTGMEMPENMLKNQLGILKKKTNYDRKLLEGGALRLEDAFNLDENYEFVQDESSQNLVVKVKVKDNYEDIAEDGQIMETGVLRYANCFLEPGKTQGKNVSGPNVLVTADDPYTEEVMRNDHFDNFEENREKMKWYLVYKEREIIKEFTKGEHGYLEVRGTRMNQDKLRFEDTRIVVN